MKKRMTAFVTFLLSACILLTGCGSAATVPAPAATPGAPDTGEVSELHSYEVGGETLLCRTRIEDYISGEIFSYFDLAKDLGWRGEMPELEGVLTMNTYIYEYGDVTARLMLHSKYHHIYGLGFGDSSNKVSEDMLLEEDDPVKMMVINGQGGETIDFRLAVLVTYILENYRNDPFTDPFEGMFRYDGVYHAE